MKANKFFAVALAALALVGFSACDKKDQNGASSGTDSETALALDPTSIQLKVGETATITATVEAEWAVDKAEVATVRGDGKTATVVAVAEGTAIVTATANGKTKQCVVLVEKAGGEEGGNALKGSQVWPIILDGTTLEANQSKVVASFQPNDVDQFLYVWEATYEGTDALGLNFYGNSDGYLAMKVTTLGWAGCGFCLTESGNGWQAAEALRAAIVANPDQYFLHLAIKSTDNYGQCFYFMGSEATKFVLGAASVYDGPVYGNFDRDGSWAEFDIPMSAYVNALATPVAAGVNVFVALTEGVQGAALNLDAVYFYKK